MLKTLMDEWGNMLQLQSYFEGLKDNPMFAFMFKYIKKFMIIRIIVHEYSHLIALRYMGYTGLIKSFNLDAVYPLEFAQMTCQELTLFYGAGAIGELVYAMYNLLFTSQSEEGVLVDLMILIHAFIYGYFEAFMPHIWWNTGATLGFLAGWLFLAFCVVKRSIELTQSQP